MTLNEGDLLTVDKDIISSQGNLRLAVGDKVEIAKVHKRDGFIGKNTHTWYPDKIVGFSIKGFEGSVFGTLVFKETKHL